MDRPLWPTVVAGIVASQSGRVAEAEEHLSAAWEACGDNEHALRCIVAHYLADAQDEVWSELEWDRRALEAHAHVRDAELAPLGIPSAKAFLPSLHLNLGDVWLRAGNPVEAERHVLEAQVALDELGDDQYGAMVRKGVASLSRRVAEAKPNRSTTVIQGKVGQVGLEPTTDGL